MTTSESTADGSLMKVLMAMVLIQKVHSVVSHLAENAGKIMNVGVKRFLLILCL
jgi:hypothetical protein